MEGGRSAAEAAVSSKQKVHSVVVLGAVLAYVLIASFPLSFRRFAPGLDNSWRWAINDAARAGFKFGRDVNFTYGPLGYLLEPLDVGSNMVQALVFWVLMHALFGALLGISLWRRRAPVAAVAFGLSFALALAAGLLAEYQLLVILALLLFATLESTGHWRVAGLAGVGFLAGLFLFMKFSIGLAALGMLVLAAAFELRRARRGEWKAVAVGVGFWVVTVVGLALRFMGSPGSLASWLRASLAISDGYSVAMSAGVPTSTAIAGIVSLLLYVGVAVLLFLWRRSWSAAILGAVLLAPLWTSFKHGFVHHQGRPYFPVILAALSLLLIASPSRKHAAIIGAAFVAVVGAMLATTCRLDPRAPCHGGQSVPVGQVDVFRVRPVVAALRGWRQLDAALHFPSNRASNREFSTRALSRDVLPPDMLAIVRQGGATVDVVPWEIADIPANHLRWSPNPILQTYSAYTAYLDMRSAAHFSGAGAPGFVIVNFAAIGGRHLMLDVPATWRALLSNYTAVAVDEGRNLLLLERSDHLERLALRRIGAQTGHFSEWISVPASPRLVFAAVELRLRPIGALTKFFWFIDSVFIDVRFDNGKEATYRLVPDTAGDGMLIGGLPGDIIQLADLFGGAVDQRVVQFRIRGPGAHSYQQPFRIIWDGSG